MHCGQGLVLRIINVQLPCCIHSVYQAIGLHDIAEKLQVLLFLVKKSWHLQRKCT